MELKLDSKADLEALHANQVTETSGLEYKSSGSVENTDGKKSEMAKDVSAMANANGGQIIYGMTEKEHLPAGLDAGISPKPFDGLWFEQVIQQNIKPSIEGLKIQSVPAGNGNNYFVLTIPASRTVHQARDGRYYRRRNFRIDIMEDYEIREAMNRATTPEPFLELSLPEHRTPITWPEDPEKHSHPIQFDAIIGNRSATPVLYTHVTISIDQTLVLVRSGGDGWDETTHDDGHPMYSIFFKLVTPHHFPLFKETSFTLGKGTAFAIDRKFESGDSLYRVSYRISTPGYSTYKKGEMIKRANEIGLRWLK